MTAPLSAPKAATTRFSAVSALEPAGDGRFEASVHPEWTIAGKPNGGYLLAMMGRAAEAISSQPDVIAASAHYLHAPEPGPVLIEADVLRHGRSTSQIRVGMSQGGQACVESLMLTSWLDPTATPYWDQGAPQPAGPDYEATPRLVPRVGGLRVAIMDQIEVRMDPETSGFTRDEPGGQGELRGWLALPGGESFDSAALLFAVDAFPPGTFEIEFAGWVPTLELTVYVRALPARGPLRVIQKAELIDGRRVDETCHVWDQAGRLVAQGRQLAGIRLG